MAKSNRIDIFIISLIRGRGTTCLLSKTPIKFLIKYFHQLGNTQKKQFTNDSSEMSSFHSVIKLQILELTVIGLHKR